MTVDAQTNSQRDILLSIPMGYQPEGSNRQIHRRRLELTLKLIARFKIISPTVVQQIYSIPRPKALIHLGQLVREGLLEKVDTIRSPDGRVYILTHAGARFAEDLLGVAVPFRSASSPAHQFNHNSVVHDLMMQYCCHLTDKKGSPLWDGYLTEIEFKRLYKSNAIRNVDALVKSQGELIALELENSHKTYATHQTNLRKFLEALKNGIYSKIYFPSASERILADTKRQHHFFLEHAASRSTKNLPALSEQDIALLKEALIYRTKFCDELSEIFYP